VFVSFNHPLVPDPVLDPTNWSVTILNVLRTVDSAIALAGNVTLFLGMPIGPNMVSDRVSFSPPPFDVLSDTARSVAAPAFTDFLIT
jgi:hypothetical protein